MLATGIICESLTERDFPRLGLACLVSLGFPAKVGFEMITGATLFVDSKTADLTPVPLVHVAGGLIGLLFGLNQGGLVSPGCLPIPFCAARKVIRSTN